MPRSLKLRMSVMSKKCHMRAYGSAPIRGSIFREVGILVGPLDAVGPVHSVAQRALASSPGTKP
jgi:hypothetical protein